MPSITQPFPKKLFWANVERSPRFGRRGCRRWLGRIGADGLGRFAGRPAHHVAFELEHGPLGDRELAPRCKTPLCVNPLHWAIAESARTARRGAPRLPSFPKPTSSDWGIEPPAVEEAPLTPQEPTVCPWPRFPQLSETQHRVLAYLVGYIDSHGYAPTLTETQLAVGFRSVSSVSNHMQVLQIKYFITRTEGKGRVRSTRITTKARLYIAYMAQERGALCDD